MSSSQAPLAAQSLLRYMSESLPKQSSTDRPLKDAYAAVALFSHACMLAVGFRLIGLGEDHRIEAQSDETNVKALPSEWDANSTYAFRYAHSQSSMEYLVKVSRLGNKALIFGVGLGDDKTASMEIKVQDYISEGSLPKAEDASDILANVFISPGRISDLSNLFKTNILQKLAPGIHKEGYEEDTREQIHNEREATRRDQEPRRDPLRDDPVPEPARPYPFDDPLAATPRRPMPAGDFPPPGFEDEYEINRPPRGMPGIGGGYGGYRPPNIGERDLYPQGLGPHDPLRMGPGGGFGGGGGGMHPTFDDPMFGGTGGLGGGYDPHAPPGARYDPVGPGDGPPNLRGGPRFPGGGPGRGGGFGGGNPFGGFGRGDFI